VILACSKTLVEKRVAENRVQNRMWNSCSDFIIKDIIKETWRLNSPELNFLDHYVWENIRDQSHVSSKTEDIAELNEMLQMTV